MSRQSGRRHLVDNPSSAPDISKCNVGGIAAPGLCRLVRSRLFENGTAPLLTDHQRLSKNNYLPDVPRHAGNIQMQSSGMARAEESSELP